MNYLGKRKLSFTHKINSTIKIDSMKPTCFANTNTHKYNFIKHVWFHHTFKIKIIL